MNTLLPASPCSKPLISLGLTVVTLTVRDLPPAARTSSTDCPGITLLSSRCSRCTRMDEALTSPASSRGTRTSMPLMLAMRSPATMPALSAGPPSCTSEINTPVVSRVLPDPPMVMPMTPCSSAPFTMASLNADAATSLAFTDFILPPDHTSSVTSSPALCLPISRRSLLLSTLAISGSPASSREALRETPLIVTKRFPASSPAFSAGLPRVTSAINRPRVSRRSPPVVATPSTGRSLASAFDSILNT